MINRPYSKVIIELNNNYNLDEIKELLSSKGETEINFVFKHKDKQASFLLCNKIENSI